MKTIVTLSTLIAAASLTNAATLFTTDFDSHGIAGSSTTTTGISFTTDASITSVTQLSAIGGGTNGFTNKGVTFSDANNLYVDQNLNTGNAQGYSFDFTVAAGQSIDLTSLSIVATHTNNTGTQDQVGSSRLNFSLSGGTLGAALTGFSTENYGDAGYHTVPFDVSGNTIGAGTYTVQVFSDNLSGVGGSFASYNGITLEGEVIPEPSSTLLLGIGGLSLIFRRRK